MFWPDKRKQYPNLLQFLNETKNRKVSVTDWPMIAASAITALLAMTAASCLVSGFLIPGSVAAVATLASIVGLVRLERRPKPEPDPARRLAGEAQPIVRSMHALAEGNKLHRQLDEATIQMLEECAHHWYRVQVVFKSPFWSSERLPPQYANLREHALSGAEATMDEVMLLHRAYMPAKVESRNAIEFIEDALDEFVFKKTRVPGNLPASFEPTMRIAEKLQTLADEAEKISRELVVDPATAASREPGSALDASIFELKQIRAAEDELRQNLQG
jgi:hypothetical protein